MVPHRPPLVRRHRRTAAKKQRRRAAALVFRIGIPQHNVVAKHRPGTRTSGPSFRAFQPKRGCPISGRAVAFHGVAPIISELHRHPTAARPACIHTRHDRARGLIADWRQHPPAVSYHNIVAKHHLVRRSELKRLPHIAHSHRVHHLHPLHPRVQQIQPVLEVVPEHVMVEDPGAGRTPRTQPIAVTARLLIATLRHRHGVSRGKLLDAPGKLHHRAAHRQPAGH